jgi:hypothetical protein
MTILEIVLVSLVGCALAYWVGTFLFKKDTEKEDRRRAANQTAGVLRALGLKKTPEFLEDYGVGDYSGMANKIKELAKLFLTGQDALVAEFGQVFESVLDAKLKTETGRAYIAAKLEDATKVTDASVIQDAPKAATV